MLNINRQDYSISTDQDQLDVKAIHAFLSTSYWSPGIPIAVVRHAIENSLCFGVFHGTEQVGFARVITDYATTYYICDVIIDSKYRGYGFGKKLMESIVSDQDFCDLKGILVTKDAHGLYEKFGFAKDGSIFMQKARKI